jgi:transformation/transcription domain-associated protein
VTAKRNLKFTVPKVVAVSPQMRLVEDNPSSLSLLDVFKHSCSKRGVEYDAAITRYYEKIAAIQVTFPTFSIPTIAFTAPDLDFCVCVI